MSGPGELPLSIVICDDADPVAVATLSGVSRLVAVDAERLSEIPGMDPVVLLVWHTVSIDAEYLSRFKCLRVIIRMGVGYDNVDIEAAGKLGIAVSNIPNYGTEEVADAAMSHILNLYRRTLEMEKWTHKNHPLINAVQTSAVAQGVTRVRGQKLGLVGLGRIGVAVCNRAKPFGFDMSFYDPCLPAGVEKSHGIRRHYDFDELLAESDIVSFHCNLTAANKHMLNSQSIAKMKNGARLVNTARGGLIDETALVAALEQGKFASVALDVHEEEPYVRDQSALAKFTNVYCLPHLAWFSEQSLAEIWQIAVEEICRALKKNATCTDLRLCLNRDVMCPEAARRVWS
ncbi:C-terminal-binding protein-like [Sycon ciliatum]|uniref:C-terminal-binding protein-like n=1 Tax=Sycon ciliatum TaxID=27933 RepID=UPI0020ACF7D0|eukprot:scpid85241/ scgid32774/ C-terminal-binding protein; dCtBP